MQKNKLVFEFVKFKYLELIIMKFSVKFLAKIDVLFTFKFKFVVVMFTLI